MTKAETSINVRHEPMRIGQTLRSEAGGPENGMSSGGREAWPALTPRGNNRRNGIPYTSGCLRLFTVRRGSGRSPHAAAHWAMDSITGASVWPLVVSV